MSSTTPADSFSGIPFPFTSTLATHTYLDMTLSTSSHSSYADTHDDDAMQSAEVDAILALPRQAPAPAPDVPITQHEKDDVAMSEEQPNAHPPLEMDVDADGGMQPIPDHDNDQSKSSALSSLGSIHVAQRVPVPVPSPRALGRDMSNTPTRPDFARQIVQLRVDTSCPGPAPAAAFHDHQEGDGDWADGDEELLPFTPGTPSKMKGYLHTDTHTHNTQFNSPRTRQTATGQLTSPLPPTPLPLTALLTSRTGFFRVPGTGNAIGAAADAAGKVEVVLGDTYAYGGLVPDEVAKVRVGAGAGADSPLGLKVESQHGQESLEAMMRLAGTVARARRGT